MSLAKPLAGGMPIGAVLLKQAVADVMKPGGGCGVAGAATAAVVGV
jgi:acetylornithine/succinyldiaminopimelate/putrescine aminotransferase